MDEIASRYDEVPSASQPVAGTINFQAGTPGLVLNVNKSINQVKQALQSPTNRSAELVIENTEPPRPSFDNLEILIKQIIDRSQFDGLTEIYVLDLENRKELNFAYEEGVDYDPGISFSSWSTIKIPIMVSTFKKLSEPAPQAALDLIKLMIAESQNPPADQLMENYLDPTLGPIIVTNDMQAIGLKNTFLAGHFYYGAPLLQRDYTTDPDVYSQTTTPDLGMLLDDIYQCAQNGGGTLTAVFDGQLTQSECQLMITFLSQNKLGDFIQGGLPDGTQFAHKHGWVAEVDGLLHTMIDAGIVFSPGGNYVIVLAMYQPTQLIFNVGNPLAIQISSAIYNYFNIQ